MATNILKWEEGTEITLDTEVEAPAAGWTLNYVSVLRIGSAVQVHIEAAWAAAAASLVCTLPPDFAPGDTVTTPDGKFTIGNDGTVHYTGSTTAGGNAIAQANYAAGLASP